MSNGLDALRVAIGIDSFWGGVRCLPKLGMIVRTCKTLHGECDLAYAVEAMGKDRKIHKIWAKRWFGFNGYRFDGSSPTLVNALRILRGLGGFSVYGPVALMIREKETAKKAIKDQEIERVLEIKRKAVAQRRGELDRRMDEMNLPKKGFFYNLVAGCSNAVDDLLMSEIRKHHVRESKHALARIERKKAIDMLLAKEKIQCSGYLYDKCVWSVHMRIDADMIHELNMSRNDSLINQVVRDLRDRAGHFFKGIYAKARDFISKGSYVDDNGQCVWNQWEEWDYRHQHHIWID